MVAFATDPLIVRALNTPDSDAHPLVWPLLDAWHWISDGYCWIEDRDTGKLGPLTPNYVQTAIWREMLRQAIEGLPIRIIVPKARRHGVSTIVQAILRYLSSRYTGRRAVTYAHTEPDTRKIFELPKRMQQHERADIPIGAASIKWPDIDSIYECRTASGLGVSRGSGIHYEHLSEWASLVGTSGLDRDAGTAMLHAVADAPHTIIVIESTGNGNTGDFVERCDRASKGLGPFVLMFFPWYSDPRSVATPPEGFTLTGAEALMQKTYNLSMPQMAWYRRKFTEACGDGKNLAAVARFQHEYPTTLEECFSVAKGRVFPHFTRLGHVPKEDNIIRLRAILDQQHGKARSLARYGADTILAPAHVDPPSWEFYRAIDWGSSFDHPFVCLWIAHDPHAPPGFAIHPDCGDAIREFLDYARDERTGRPKKQHDHAPDAARILVASLRLTGFVYVYRCYYDRDPPPLPAIARTIHEMSGWTLPPTADERDLAKFEAGAAGENYVATVADRSRPDSINTFTCWGIPTIAHKAPTSQLTGQGEVEDGIAILASLMCGEAWLSPPPEKTTEEIAAEAVSAIRGEFNQGRRVAPTREQREALQQIMAATQEEEAGWGSEWPQV